MPWRYRHNQQTGGFCRECGEAGKLISRPRSASRVRHFLVYGMPAPEVWSCPNGHETDGRTGRILSLGRSRTPRVLRKARDLAAAIHRERMVEPVPLTYLMAVGAGLALGFVLDLLLGWAWWLVLVGFVAVVWVFFLSSAFWHGGRRRVMERIRFTLDPERQQRRELTSLTARVEEGPIRAYGVDGWVGPVALGGWGGGNDEISSITLAHFVDEDDPAPAIEVSYHPASRYVDSALADDVLEDFVENSIEMPTATEPGDLGRRVAQRRWEARRRPPPPWQPTAIEVDGVAVSFSALVRPDAISALASVGDGYVVVKAVGREPGSFALSRVVDIGPHVSGTLSKMFERPEG